MTKDKFVARYLTRQDYLLYKLHYKYHELRLHL